MLEKLVSKNIYKLSVLGTKAVNENGVSWVDVPALGLEVRIALNDIEDLGEVYVIKNPIVRKLDYINNKGEEIVALDKLCNLKQPNEKDSASFAYLRKNGYIGCVATINQNKIVITEELENGFEAILKGEFKFDTQK